MENGGDGVVVLGGNAGYAGSGLGSLVGCVRGAAGGPGRASRAAYFFFLASGSE